MPMNCSMSLNLLFRLYALDNLLDFPAAVLYIFHSSHLSKLIVAVGD
jgi:hypothetical protein